MAILPVASAKCGCAVEATVSGRTMDTGRTQVNVVGIESGTIKGREPIDQGNLSTDF